MSEDWRVLAAVERLEAWSHAESVIEGPRFMADLRTVLGLARQVLESRAAALYPPCAACGHRKGDHYGPNGECWFVDVGSCESACSGYEDEDGPRRPAHGLPVPIDHPNADGVGYL